MNKKGKAHLIGTEESDQQRSYDEITGSLFAFQRNLVGMKYQISGLLKKERFSENGN